MSLEAKKRLIEDVSTRLEDDLTVSKMRRVQEEMAGALTGYSVEDAQNEGNEQENKKLMEIFTSAKRVEGKSLKTISRYEYIIGRLTKHTGLPLARIGINDIREYFTAEKERGIADSTLEGYREVYSSVFGWLHKEELIKKNPMANLPSIKFQQKVRLPYSNTDLEVIKEHCECIRDKAIVCFLYATGARIDEVCRLNRDDVNLKELEATVLGKGNKERTVYIDEVAAMMVERYLAERTDDNPALFVSRLTPWKRIHPGGVRAMLKRLEKSSGIENIHPHRFRRTLTTNLIDHGMTIQEVAAILGHSNIETTMKYVYSRKANVKNNYRKYF